MNNQWGQAHCCPINSISFMPAFWVHRERVGERGSKNNNCMNSNSLTLVAHGILPAATLVRPSTSSFSREEKGRSVYIAAMQIHVPRVGTTGISAIRHCLVRGTHPTVNL